MEKIKYNKSEEPIIISKTTSDRILKEDKPADIMALYWFYYYTAKWQGNNQAKSTTGYVSKGLHWSEAKVRKNKKILETLGLIEQIKKIDKKTKRILGWYIKVNFIWSEKATLTKKHRVEKDTGWKSDTQIPITNNKIPLTNNKILAKTSFAGINEILELFYKINPLFNFGNKTQRSALEELIKKFGVDKAKKTVEYALSIQNEQYSPRITTPLQLKNKLGDLLAYYEKGRESKVLIID